MINGDPTQDLATYPSAPMPTGVAAAVGFAGAVLAATVAVAVRSTHDPLLALIPLGALTAAVAAFTTWAGGLATAWMCWALDSGFVIGREGNLSFSPAAQLATLVLIAVALVFGLAGRSYRSRRVRRVEEIFLVQPIQSWKDRPETFS